MLIRLALLCVVPALLIAQDVPLSDIVALQIENLRLREELVRLEREALFRNVCDAAKIPADECLIDPAAKLVKRVPRPAPISTTKEK